MKRKNKLPPWLRPKDVPAKVKVGVGWYSEEQWAKVKAGAEDAERFEATYSDWVQMAQQSLANLRAAGIVAEKSYIDAEELRAWCLVHGRTNNAAARAEFVREQARRASSDSRPAPGEQQ